jgi:chromate transporter
MPETPKPSLKNLAMLFLRLGFLAFGGPAAHIAMMESEVVVRNKWLTHEELLDMIGATNLIPGPNSTQLAIYIGFKLGGIPGLLLAGVCFILPAVAITLLLAVLYVRYGTMPSAEPMLLGIRAAIIAVILATVYRLGKSTMKTSFKIVIGIVVCVLYLLHLNEIVLLFGAGVVGMFWANRETISGSIKNGFTLLVAPLGVATAGVVVDSIKDEPTLLAVGLSFLKIGSTLYGSGYVLVAFLQRELIDSHHWMTQRQLLDAVAIGQFTPGPVLSTATFVGYLLLGIPGAAVATGSIFLPSFLLIFLIGPVVSKLKGSPLMRGFLDGVNAAALGLMLAVATSLAIGSLTSPIAISIFVIAAVALLVSKTNPAWIILSGALLGYLGTLVLA